MERNETESPLGVPRPPNSAERTWRFVNRDGTSNVEPASFRRDSFTDLYHVLLSTSWLKLLLLVALAYLCLNLLFGLGYFLAGPDALSGVRLHSELERWIDCFFFSVQTLATIGYGRISPVSIIAHLLVMLEALIGLISLALATGIVFARFSRPTARVKFSDRAVLTRIDGRPCLLFRMANARLNQIVEAQVRVALTRFETTVEGITYREIYDLKLDRDRSPIFSMSWTIIHPIESSSPLYHATRESIVQSELEIIATVTGTDETFSQLVHSRFSYTAEDLVWNADFDDVLSRSPRGKIHVALERLNAIHPSRGVPIDGPIE